MCESLFMLKLFTCMAYIEPPEAPRSLVVSATSAYTIPANWTPPAELGGRDDLFYQVEHSDPDNLGSFTGTVYLSGEDTTKFVLNNKFPTCIVTYDLHVAIWIHICK